MNPKTVPQATIEEIMLYWSSGKTLEQVAKEFDRPVRSVEQIVARYKHAYERNFNFPHIIHAKRFGA